MLRLRDSAITPRQQNTADAYANAQRVFHGTTTLPGLLIGANGFSEIAHARTGAMLGPGVYFAEHFSKSAQYLLNVYGDPTKGGAGWVFGVDLTMGVTRHTGGPGQAVEMTPVDRARATTDDFDTYHAHATGDTTTGWQLINPEILVRHERVNELAIPRLLFRVEVKATVAAPAALPDDARLARLHPRRDDLTAEGLGVVEDPAHLHVPFATTTPELGEALRRVHRGTSKVPDPFETLPLRELVSATPYIPRAALQQFLDATTRDAHLDALRTAGEFFTYAIRVDGVVYVVDGITELTAKWLENPDASAAIRVKTLPADLRHHLPKPLPETVPAPPAADIRPSTKFLGFPDTLGGGELPPGVTVVKPMDRYDLRTIASSRRFLYNPTTRHLIVGGEVQRIGSHVEDLGWVRSLPDGEALWENFDAYVTGYLNTYLGPQQERAVLVAINRWAAPRARSQAVAGQGFLVDAAQRSDQLDSLARVFVSRLSVTTETALQTYGLNTTFGKEFPSLFDRDIRPSTKGPEPGEPIVRWRQQGKSMRLRIELRGEPEIGDVDRRVGEPGGGPEIGYITLSNLPPDQLYDPDFLWVDNIRVREDFRRLGYGRRLYELAFQIAKEKGLKGIASQQYPQRAGRTRVDVDQAPARGRDAGDSGEPAGPPGPRHGGLLRRAEHGAADVGVPRRRVRSRRGRSAHAPALPLGDGAARRRRSRGQLAPALPPLA